MTDERRMSTVDELRAAGASPKAIELHYDLSDEFFGLWLGLLLGLLVRVVGPDRCHRQPRPRPATQARPLR